MHNICEMKDDKKNYKKENSIGPIVPKNKIKIILFWTVYHTFQSSHFLYLCSRNSSDISCIWPQLQR